MKIHAKNVEEEAISQFTSCMSDPSVIDGALMPDAHTWYTLPIGWVILNKWKIFPSYVGYDIGCWVCWVKTNLKKSDIIGKEKEIFDKIYIEIPCWEWKWGTYDWSIELPITDIGKKFFESNLNQIGTLGGGNHFIEIGYDEDETIWVIAHSWSRGFGWKLGDYYMRLAKNLNIITEEFEKAFQKKNIGVYTHNPDKYGEILHIAIDKYIVSETKWECGGNNGFELDSEEWKNYLMDMTFALEFALLNRKIMIDKVLKILWAEQLLFINKNHNCADILENGHILHRKGATSSNIGEYGIIPWNMKEWSVIVEWKWNKDFLCCSSHWAGRILSRKKAQAQIDIKDFENDMVGIMALVNEETKDESRFAYKNFSEVLDLQKDSIKILHHIIPLINIKW